MLAAALDQGQDVEMLLPGGISGSVFASEPDSGVRKASDPGISGVHVELLSAAGDVLAEAITDETGDFEFPALAPGRYALRQAQPTGWLDGYDLVGSGGGRRSAANFISDIVVRPGAMLQGYEFAEIAAIQLSAAGDVESPLIGYLPPLSISWSRPIELLAPPSVEAMIRQSTRPSPPEARPSEPIFGGSSAVNEDRDAALEAFSEDEKADGKVASQAKRARAVSDEEGDDRNPDRLAVRDRAFETAASAAPDDDVEAARSGPENDVIHRPERAAVARRPLWASGTAKKPAA